MAKRPRVKNMCGKLTANTGVWTSRIVFLHVHHNKNSQRHREQRRRWNKWWWSRFNLSLMHCWGMRSFNRPYNFSVHTRLILLRERCSRDYKCSLSPGILSLQLFHLLQFIDSGCICHLKRRDRLCCLFLGFSEEIDEGYEHFAGCFCLINAALKHVAQRLRVVNIHLQARNSSDFSFCLWRFAKKAFFYTFIS